MAVTKSQVNKAGRTLRRFLLRPNQNSGDYDELQRAIEVIVEYRAAHQAPLAKATMGLRSMVKTIGCRAEVSQRLKRYPTIVDKIRREPTMALGNMQDIGGCRAVLDSVADLRQVEHRLRKNRPPVGYADYVTRPRDSGYRGVHIVVAYPDRGGTLRSIEVQPRTQTMHEWAIFVERLGGRLQADLKSGYGPPEIRAWLAAASEAMAIEEAGEVVSEQLLTHLKGLRDAAVPYLSGPPP